MIYYGILIALLSTLFGQFFRLELAGGAILFLDLFLPALFFSWCAKLIFQKRNIWTELKKFPVFFEGLLVVAIFLVSLFIAGINMTTIEFATSGFYLFRYTFLFLFSVVVYNEYSEFLETKEHINKIKIFFLQYITFIAVGLAILGFLQLYLYPDFRAMAEKGWDPHIGRLLSTWFDPNFLGSFFSFILTLLAGIFGVYTKKYPILSFNFSQNKKNFTQFYNKKITGIFIFITLLLLIALLLTYSRSALLAFILPTFILGIIYFRGLLLSLSFAIILLLPFSPRATERITDGIHSAVSITETNSMFVPDPTARLRVENMQQGLQLAHQNFWTGIGFNTIRLHKTKNIHSSGGFDSSLLTTLVTSGIFGLIAFLFFYFRLA
ncbi:TPA: hypothetical protein EYP45_04995, partial [Candidatus Peregrinibacteria bacterium]|nr:hypothetical protein [Candidatus Peregrinibacteria bacterium]